MNSEQSQPERKSHRMLRMLTLIQSRPGWNAPRLAAELGIDERTIYRYLDDLSLVGIPHYFDTETDGYRIRKDFFLPPIQLTPEEALSLSVLCCELAEKEQIPYLKPAWRALSKIEAQLPPSVQSELVPLHGRIHVQTAQSSPADGWVDVYETIREAVASRRNLRCLYEANNADAEVNEEFDFEPYALFFSVRAWYALGRHAGRDAVRSLKLSRFLKVVRTERYFEPDPGFSLSSHLGNAWRMIRGDEEYEVAIYFDASFTQTMSDTQWHRTQEIDFNDDGSSIFRCTVAGLDEIVWWVLSMGPHCRVLEPAALRERVRDLAQRTAMQYE